MDHRIEGKVVSISEAGNLVTDIMAGQLSGAPTDERTRISCAGHETLGIFPADHSEPDSTLLAFVDADGRLQLAIVGISISAMLNIGAGEKVVVQWE